LRGYTNGRNYRGRLRVRGVRSDHLLGDELRENLMPQTSTGRTVMARFVSEYGKRGKNIFYAKANSSKKFASKMGESSVYNRGHK
jgi:hypothetical protein